VAAAKKPQRLGELGCPDRPRETRRCLDQGCDPRSAFSFLFEALRHYEHLFKRLDLVHEFFADPYNFAR